MSWPDDLRPRFIVSTLVGFEIRPGSGTGKGGLGYPPVSAYVLDRAYCDRVVAVIEPRGKGVRSSQCIGLAEIAAAELNARDALEALDG